MGGGLEVISGEALVAQMKKNQPTSCSACVTSGERPGRNAAADRTIVGTSRNNQLPVPAPSCSHASAVEFARLVVRRRQVRLARRAYAEARPAAHPGLVTADRR
jgi:hypothetical protein